MSHSNFLLQCFPFATTTRPRLSHGRCGFKISRYMYASYSRPGEGGGAIITDAKQDSTVDFGYVEVDA